MFFARASQGICMDLPYPMIQLTYDPFQKNLWAAAAPKCCQSGSTSWCPNCMATARRAASTTPPGRG